MNYSLSEQKKHLNNSSLEQVLEVGSSDSRSEVAVTSKAYLTAEIERAQQMLFVCVTSFYLPLQHQRG
jgi:hypothetical protein